MFEMRQNGLMEVENPSEYMLSGKPEGASGSVVACSMEGTRPILVEVQALVCHSNFGVRGERLQAPILTGKSSDGST